MQHRDSWSKLQLRQHYCIGPGLLRNRCQEGIKSKKDLIFGENVYENKSGEMQRRLGEPSDYNTSLALSEGRLVGVLQTTEQSKKSPQCKRGDGFQNAVVGPSSIKIPVVRGQQGTLSWPP